MATSLGTATLFLSADAKEFNRALDKAGYAAKKKVGAISDTMMGVGKAMTAIGAVGAAAIGGTVTSWAKMGDEVAKTAKRTGLSTEAISEFRHAAEQTGTSLGDFENGIRRMQRAVNEAGQGVGSYEDSLAQIGLKYSDLAGLNPEEQFLTIADAMSNVQDATMQSAIAQEIFGRSGTQLLPLINEGRAGLNAYALEARQLGIVFDQEGAAKAELFTDTMDELKKTFQGVIITIGPFIADNLIPLANWIKENVISVREWIAAHPVLTNWLMKAGMAVTGLALTLGPLLIVGGKALLMFTQLKAMTAILAGAQGLTGVATAAGGATQAAAGMTAASGGLAASLLPLVATGGLLAIGIGLLAGIAIAAYNAKQAWDGAAASQEQADGSMARLVQTLKDQGVQIDDTALKGKSHNEQMELLKQAVTEAEQAQQREISALNGVSQGFVSATQSGNAFASTTQQNAQRSVEASRSQAVYNSQIERYLRLTGQADKIPSGGGGLPGFAKGGITPGGPVMVGEEGPEIIVPPAGSRVIPNGEGGGLAPNVTINVNGANADPDQLARKIGETVRRELQGVGA